MAEILKFLYNHKTKITGFLLAFLGSIQASFAMLQPIMSATHYAYLTIFVGAFIAGLGFLNSTKPTV